MNIISYNPGHDGAIAILQDSRLIMSLEAEKDSNYRYSSTSIPDLLNVFGQMEDLPDVICQGGWWSKDHHDYLYGQEMNAGYRGVSNSNIILQQRKFLNKKINYFSSSHERSHILCAFGMSDLPQGSPCYALIWEGDIGAFYDIDKDFNITLIGEVLNQPGNRYAALYGLADPSFPKNGQYPRMSDAGKLMALASFSDRTIPTLEEKKLLHFLLNGPRRSLAEYVDINNAPHLNIGLEDVEFRNFAGIYSDAIFNIFYTFAKKNLKKKQPLIIAGGCGLNCDWNTKWRESNLFSEIFVPPVANDSGSAIGTAIDAQFNLTGNLKIDWTVYSGLDFAKNGLLNENKYDIYNLDCEEISKLLTNGFILGWVNGKYEIGPRALGNRSIIAAPFSDETRIRLNKIKQREQFRPIAPICLLEDAIQWFRCNYDSPYMLYTYKATTNNLRAVTHVNGTARIQTVTATSNKPMHDLLSAFKKATGYGVLCNTSLNFNGKGFINSTKDLDIYTLNHGLDGFVIEGKAYLLKNSEKYQLYLNSSNCALSMIRKP